MNKCPHCGYELFPLDDVCDKCGSAITPVGADENIILKALSSKNDKVFSGAASAKSSKSVKTEKKSGAENKSGTQKPAKETKAASEDAGRQKVSVKKILMIIGCSIIGLIAVGGLAIGIILTIIKSQGGSTILDSASEYFQEKVGNMDEYEIIDSDDFEDESYDEYADDVEYFTEDEDAEEYIDENDSDSFEDEEDTDEVEYSEGLEMPDEDSEEVVQGAENIGKTFKIGESFTYDNITYKATSFDRDVEETSENENSDDEYEDADEVEYQEEEEDEELYQLNFTVVNNSDTSKDVDILGTYYEDDVEMNTYTDDEKDSFATLEPGQSADLAVSLYVTKGASSGKYELEIGSYLGEIVTFSLF